MTTKEKPVSLEGVHTHTHRYSYRKDRNYLLDATVYSTCKSSIWALTSSLIEQNKGSNTFYNHIKKADYMQK